MITRDNDSVIISAHLFENWMGFSSTGFHDQLAAVFGGAHTWTWGTHLRGKQPIFKKKSVLPIGGVTELSKHLIVCFTGQVHPPNSAGTKFHSLPEHQITMWMAVSEHAKMFGTVLRQSNWTQASWHLNEECKLREKLFPGCLSPRTRILIHAARETGAGARYAGHGGGGAVWACGENNTIAETENCWRNITKRWKGAWVKRLNVDAKGLVVQS